MTESTVKSPKSEWMTTNRIQTLIDGIFAISMTLLVLTLEVPDFTPPITNATIYEYLISLIPKFYVYGLSFLLLAVFWRVNHHHFHFIKKANIQLLWINVVWLMFVALVPFSTTLIGEYGHLLYATLFFHINLFFIAFFSSLNWFYAYKKGLTSMKYTSLTFRRHLGRNLIFPLTAVLAIIVSFLNPTASSLVYLFIPLFKKIDKSLLQN